MSIDIPKIASELNSLAAQGFTKRLQSIRAEHTKKRQLGNDLFRLDSTVQNDFAFHFGGRSECQFNIGWMNLYGDEVFRYGVALSLETSRSYPDPKILFSKIDRLRTFLSQNNFSFGFHLTVGHDEIEWTQLNDSLKEAGKFVFFGKVCDPKNLDLEEVLLTFEDLLELYEYVSFGDTDSLDLNAGSLNLSGARRLADGTTKYELGRREVERRAEHRTIQNELMGLFDSNTRLGVEVKRETGGMVDLVTELDGNYHFYEVKTCVTARHCIREAIGQLLDYAFRSVHSRPVAKLIVVGRGTLKPDDERYLRKLNELISVPIEYLQIPQ
ncbi:hypothetical protein [Aquilutibacter rugosus]|uniref:hypothetical protein n=1 Tax=Aquilutibacter rugosus TaxID=3115820 RepID=UPI002F4126BF